MSRDGITDATLTLKEGPENLERGVMGETYTCKVLPQLLQDQPGGWGDRGGCMGGGCLHSDKRI